METIQLHPWLSTPEATEAARKAVQIPLNLLPALASRMTREELETKALAILTECALPPRDEAPTECLRCHGSLENARKGAKFCSPDCRKQYAANIQTSKGGSIPAKPLGTIPPAYTGSMHTWPESDMARYAVREVGYALNNWLRANHKTL